MNSRATRIRVAALLLGLAAASMNTHAGGASAHSARAAEHVSGAAAHSITASGKLVAGALAAGLEIPASIGRVSGDAADALWREADRETDLRLPIDDVVYTAGPPPDRAIERAPIDGFGQGAPR